ncbi:MAG: phosphotransferase [Desmonostoc vinosum HA7617-LM4]|jgi:Ser/Thr protein kinase RdoA (MazF antagonist)|nr:phosphotransferase [Desmonostoc vinosum HA7617-LM4]
MQSKIDWHNLALTALAHYNISAEQLVFLGHSENVTFCVDTQSTKNQTKSFLLRIHYPIAQFRDRIWQNYAVIESELIWLNALHQDTDVVAPLPVQNLDGAFVTPLILNDTKQTLNCTLLTWVDGSPLDTEPTTIQARCVGELMAKLHQHASLWESPNFTRPKYDWQQIHTSLMRLRSLVDIDIISMTDFTVLETVVQRIREVMSALGKTLWNWGLIHADLNENNYIFDADEVRAIDFSCCGFGYYLYDIASTLKHLSPENRQSFLSGYQSLRQLPHDDQNILEALLLGATIDNFAFLALQPNEYDFLAQSIPYITEKLCSRYLKGEPFL